MGPRAREALGKFEVAYVQANGGEADETRTPEDLAYPYPKIVALIPALNEEKSIGYVVRTTMKYVDQVIVVDDVSTDNTAYLARKAGAVVLLLKRRRRLGGVVRVGLEYMKKLDPDIIVLIDSDGQHSPRDIPRLVKPILRGEGDWALGSRFLNYSKFRNFDAKDIGRNALTLIVNLLVGRGFTDALSGFRILGKETFLNLDLKFDYGYALEMDLLLCLEGYQVIEVPILKRQRLYGESKTIKNFFSYFLKQLGIIFYTLLRFKFRGSCTKRGVFS